jgi:hypothetical protein
VWSLGFSVCGFEFADWGFEFMIQGVGFQGSGFRVQEENPHGEATLGPGVQGVGCGPACRMQGVGLGIAGLGCRV